MEMQVKQKSGFIGLHRCLGWLSCYSVWKLRFLFIWLQWLHFGWLVLGFGFFWGFFLFVCWRFFCLVWGCEVFGLVWFELFGLRAFFSLVFDVGFFGFVFGGVFKVNSAYHCYRSGSEHFSSLAGNTSLS